MVLKKAVFSMNATEKSVYEKLEMSDYCTAP